MNWLSILLIFAFTDSVELEPTLSNCEVKIKKEYASKDKELISFLVTINQKKKKEGCPTFSYVGLSKFMDAEWIIFPVSKDSDTEISIQLRAESLEQAALHFHFESLDGLDNKPFNINTIDLKLDDL